MSDTNRKITLAARPAGYPKESDFKLVEEPVLEPAEGQYLVRTQYLSVDPYMRGRMNAVHGYADPVGIGDVMVGGTVGTVVKSRNGQFEEGEVVSGDWGWQEYAVLNGGGRKVDPAIGPISTSLGVLGMPGITAYFGYLDLCEPKAGETAFVSGAAGAVGALVGQIAKIKGCRVVGSAGDDEKIAYLLDECGFDAAFNYKKETDYLAKVHELCPNGIDTYFDNVGGAMTDAVLMNINLFARISICGQISQYNLEGPEFGPRLWGLLLVRQARAEGFIVSRFYDRYREGQEQMAQWIEAGKIRYREDVVEGIENTPGALIRMLKGENKGKQLVRVWDSHSSA